MTIEAFVKILSEALENICRNFSYYGRVNLKNYDK